MNDRTYKGSQRAGIKEALNKMIDIGAVGEEMNWKDAKAEMEVAILEEWCNPMAKDISAWKQAVEEEIAELNELLSDLVVKNIDLEKEIARLREEVEAWRKRFPTAGYNGDEIVISG